MRAQPHDDELLAHGQAPRRGARAACAAPQGGLLLRLSHRERPEAAAGDPGGGRRPALDRALPDRALLARLPRLRSRLSAGHDSGPAPARHGHARDARAGLRRCARSLARVPEALQPRARRGADRPLAGHLRAAAADPRGDRPEGVRTTAARVRRAARRQRDGAEGQRPGWRLQANSCLPARRPDRLRGRVLDLQCARPRERDLRPHDRAGAGGPLHQPSGAGRRLREAHADLPERPVRGERDRRRGEPRERRPPAPQDRVGGLPGLPTAGSARRRVGRACSR